MFEKEAEEYCGNLDESKIKDFITDAFKDGAEFGYNKAKEEMQKNGLALQSDMDKTIEQNIQLKKQIEKMKDCLNKWYKQHNDDYYTETFYDNLLRDTEKCLWGDSVND